MSNLIDRQAAIKTPLSASFENHDKIKSYSKDTISRQAAINAITDELDRIDHVPKWVFDRLEKRLKQLPPAQPNTGKWIKLDMHRGMADHKCSVCGQECYVPTCMGEPMYAYCPNCGANLRGEQDE